MFKYIKNLIKNKNYKKLILISVIALGLTVGAVLSALAVGKFLIEKSDTIILGGSVIVVAVYFINRFSKIEVKNSNERDNYFLISKFKLKSRTTKPRRLPQKQATM